MVKVSMNVIKSALNNEFAKSAILIKGYKDSNGGESNVVVNTEVNYEDLVRQSIQFVELMTIEEIVTKSGQTADIAEKAKAEVLASFKNTLEKMALGESNDAYTHGVNARGVETYESVGKNVKLNTEHGELHVQGLIVTKEVIVEATYPARNKRALTIAKDAIRFSTPISKWRQYKLTADNVDVVAIGNKMFTATDF